MSTCKTALRVMWRHKTYLLIYLIGLSMAMVAMVGSEIIGREAGDETTYASSRATVAIVDRDGDDGSVASGMRDYLAPTCDLVALDDTERDLQDAVATNYTDLIVIIDDGFAQRFADAVRGDGRTPAVRTVTSYTSGVGAMAALQVDGYLSSLRSAYRAAALDGHDPGLAGAVAQVLAVREDTEGGVALVRTSSGDTALAMNVFGVSLQFGGYPILASLTVTIAMIMGVFGLPTTRRRTLASPQRPFARGAALLAACAVPACAAAAYYLALSVAMPVLTGCDGAMPTAGQMARCLATVLCYAAMAAALGFVLAQCGLSEEAANGFANVFSLLTTFTGGVWFSPSMMPDAVIALGRMLPAWWYNDALAAALGISGYTETGADLGAWASSTGLVAFYAAAFVCIGLAVGAVRARRAAA